MEKASSYSPVVLRVGIALVFIWFGYSQLVSAADWISYVPEWITAFTSLSAETIVHLNGVFEVVFGTALFLGFFTRVSSFLLMLHMADITYTVGFDSIGVRDFGLTIATIAIFLESSTKMTLDKFMSDGN